ncbi:MAG: hypothetical protein WDN02_02795 [Methylovirgula sp.]|uniref:hypothetical protein n=1 Tax=Methylovirgula sp. TaxID=1978224 RepID=UPI0030765EFA
MASHKLRRVIVLVSTSLLTACSTVDQFGSRIYDGNLNSQNALNQEMVLNIVRASNLQSLNFVALTQVNGGQTETVTTGLPTITIGPNLPATAKIVQVTNAVSSGVTGGYQANPLISTQFENGMLAPITPRTLSLLMSAHPREAVLFAAIQRLDVEVITPAKGTHIRPHAIARYENDPAQDFKSLEQDYSSSNELKCEGVSEAGIGPEDRKILPRLESEDFTQGTTCEFSKFSQLLHDLISYGFTTELIPQSSKPPGGGAASGNPNSGSGGTSSNSGSPQEAVGQFCFNRAIGVPLAKALNPVCGASSNQQAIRVPARTLPAGRAPRGGGTSAPGVLTNTVITTKKVQNREAEVYTTQTYSNAKTTTKGKDIIYKYDGIGEIKISVTLRSPVGVFNYLGEWLYHQREYAFPAYVSQIDDYLRQDPYYVDIVPGGSSGPCYVFVAYQGDTYCVPERSRHTAMLLSILQDLRNLNISASDLNSAFTVRLSN